MCLDILSPGIIKSFPFMLKDQTLIFSVQYHKSFYIYFVIFLIFLSALYVVFVFIFVCYPIQF